MLRKKTLNALDIASQILPFIMITATLIGVSYVYGNTLYSFKWSLSFV